MKLYLVWKKYNSNEPIIVNIIFNDYLIFHNIDFCPLIHQFYVVICKFEMQLIRRYSASEHHQDPCWLIINWAFMNKFHWLSAKSNFPGLYMLVPEHHYLPCMVGFRGGFSDLTNNYCRMLSLGQYLKAFIEWWCHRDSNLVNSNLSVMLSQGQIFEYS